MTLDALSKTFGLGDLVQAESAPRPATGVRVTFETQPGGFVEVNSETKTDRRVLT